MAEALLASKGKGIFEVKSAGIYASHGSPANPQAQDVLKQKGIHFTNHQSRPLTNSLIQWADRIYTMTENHKQALLKAFPSAISKVMTLKESAVENGKVDAALQQWDKLLVELETTRAMYMRKLSNDELSEKEKNNIEMQMNTELEDYYQRLKQIEASLPNMDIIDPFGGTIEDYKKVYLEIEKLIDMLIKKENK